MKKLLLGLLFLFSTFAANCMYGPDYSFEAFDSGDFQVTRVTNRQSGVQVTEHFYRDPQGTWYKDVNEKFEEQTKVMSSRLESILKVHLSGQHPADSRSTDMDDDSSPEYLGGNGDSINLDPPSPTIQDSNNGTPEDQGIQRKRSRVDEPGSGKDEGLNEPTSKRRKISFFEYLSTCAKMPSHPNVGLINGENICYLNAAIQCLSNLKEFRELLLAQKEAYKGNVLVTSLINLLIQLRTAPGSDPIKNKLFVDAVKGLIKQQPGNARLDVQDAEDFLSMLFARIKEENISSLAMMCGETCVCSKCNKASQQALHQPMATAKIQVDLSSGLNDICSLLGEHFKATKLAEYKCGLCKQVSVDSDKTNAILSYPRELIITLKRFKTDGSKINIPVSFPQVLDMKPYAVDEVKMQEGLLFPYELTGFVCHGFGHYIAYVKDFEDNKWRKYDDGVVTEVTEEQIKQIILDSAPAVSDAAVDRVTPYILFYKKLEGDKAIEAMQRSKEPVSVPDAAQQPAPAPAEVPVIPSDSEMGEYIDFDAFARDFSDYAAKDSNCSLM